MFKRCLILFIILQLSSTSILASSLQKTYNVINFTTSKIRDQQDVKAITQDSHGFIWFASNAGLFRFDGLNVKNYLLQTTNDNSPIVVKSLLIDSNDKLWVGTNEHLLIFEEKSETFHQVKLNADGHSFAILKLLEDKQKNIWIGTRDNGLFKIERSLTNDTISHFHKTAKNFFKISSNQIRSLYQANDDELWIGTKNGLSKYSYIDKKITHHKINMPSRLQKKLTIYSILKLKNNLLIGSSIGLIEVNTNTYSSSLYSTDTSLASHVYSVKYTHDNNLIVGSKINGLMIIDPETKEIIKLNNSQNQNSELNSNRVYSTFSDNSGNIWLGTRVGINKLTYSDNSIDLYRAKDKSSQCIASNENHAVLLDSQKNMWLGAKGKGLNLINQTKNSCKLFNKENVNLPNVTFQLIMDIKEDLEGNIWIASFNEGLIKYNPKTEKFNHLSFSDTEKTQIIQHGKILDIFIDEKNNLWLGMNNYGLVKYDQKNHTLKLFEKKIVKQLQIKKLAVKSIEHINNALWLGTAFAGLISYNEITGQIKSYLLDNKNLRIVTMAQDNKKNLWIGTRENGIFKFIPTTGEYINYQDKDGLAHNNIFDIQVDNNNNLWIGTYNGLSMFNQQKKLFTNYHEKDGMQSNDSSLGSFFDAKTGDLWLGGMNGINRIDTNTLTKKDESSSLYLTSLKINGEKVEVNNDETTSPLKENIIGAKQLTLTHKENNFAFSFANINYLNTDKLSYQYRLDGYDDWSDVARENLSANYTNIPAGEYHFQVRVTGNTGLWDGDENSIALIILPPWWLTTFALIIYSLLVLTAIYLIIHFRTRALRNKAEELERSVQHRTIELAQEKEKVEQLLEQKNEEFANLSHEFRTPLTLILGTSSQLLSSNMEDKQINRIEIIKRNGYRLLRMVDQLLNIETFRVKAISQKSLQYTGNIVRQLVDAFTDLALEKGIKLQVINIEDINFELVDDALEKIVVNLLSNAIKYTPNGGSITLETKRTLNNELYLQIVDTGIGIPNNQLDSVFEKYKRVLSKESEQITGAGIGLALIKELINSHIGSITLTSELGSGTTITVLLPIINEGKENQQNNAIPKNDQIDNIVAMELMSLTQQTALSTVKNSASFASNVQDEKIRILIIEDNPDMNKYMADCLSEDYVVISAYDGLEGVNLAIEEVPELIISDIMMPILDGYQATQKIRSNPVTNHIPIILLTSRHDLESKLKGWHHQVDEYLTKPFNVEELKIRIENLLAIRNILKKRNHQKALKSPDIEQNLLDKLIDTASVEQINKQDVFIEKLNQTLEKQHTDTSTTVNTVAKAMAMSERQLFRKLKSVLGVTPTDYLRRFRLEKACLLLAQGQSAINTAFDTGFSSQSYFSKCFKSEYGCTPSDFQKQLIVEKPLH
ncbi:MAG: ligand-binding sensor domain-containing protein/signal transduction histidine kinase [Colwellia sp.]|jgi:ligand-binding sensor domain-containing protein/signal transduction histidine kinase/CheY-like chemotaxis protein